MQDTKKSTRNAFIRGMLIGILVSLVILAFTRIGEGQYGASGIPIPDEVSLQPDSAVNEDMIAKLQALEQTINDYYYLNEVTVEDYQTGVYKGMVLGLGDIYSEYYTEEEINDLLEQIEGTFYGVGAYISLDTATGLPKISGVIKGAPAEEVGLRANDIIYEVDGASTYGLSLTEVVSMIKGAEGTEVHLTIVRTGEDDYLDIYVTRREVETPTIEYKMMEDKMAYILINEFDEVTVSQFEEALAQARQEGMEGVIFDVRANPGGSLDAVVNMLRRILPAGDIVSTKDKYGEGQVYTCDGKNQIDVPVVLLIDMNSASAAEIFAAAIKEYEIGTLVGTTTFGKGIVQQIIPFADGTAVKLTVSSYYTPLGNDIHGVGVEPHILCEFDGEAYYDSEDPFDNQLEKAKEVLRDLMKQ